MRRLLPCLVFLLWAATGGEAQEPGDMLAAARAFVAGFDEAQRTKLILPFEHGARTRWNFLPGHRPGLTLRQMNAAQRGAAHALLQTGLSAEGYATVRGIFGLEAELQSRLPVARRRRSPGWRDPLGYTVTVFGRPDAETKWGWRIEGHHLSLNFTCEGTRVTGATPFFLGANPTRVSAGSRSGLRPLAAEEDLARRLLGALDERQRQAAIVSWRAPGNIILGPGQGAGTARDVGLRAAEMTASQQALLSKVVERYAGALRNDLAAELLAGVRSAPGSLRFAWRGDTRPGRGYHYVVKGPTFVLEHSNLGDHIHSVWRGPLGEFGAGRR